MLDGEIRVERKASLTTMAAVDSTRQILHIVRPPRHLRVLGRPTVVLTATLPLSRIHELVNALSIQNLIVIQYSTV